MRRELSGSTGRVGIYSGFVGNNEGCLTIKQQQIMRLNEIAFLISIFESWLTEKEGQP
ncbi:hypothetical protein [Pseudomonas cerasi]